MSRPSPQEQAVDCRRCVHCAGIVEGQSFRCSKLADGFPWMMITWACEHFATAPSPTSPPVSADREGTEAIETMYQVNGVLVLARSWAKTHAPMQVALVESTIAKFCDLITAEDARRARPDPKDAAILALANALILVRGTLNMLEHGRPVVTTAIAALNEAVRLPVVDKCLGDADLRAAGVEPTPAAQEGKASR